MLVEKSSGYFIYAATVIKFIDDKNFRPTEQLEIIRNLATSNDDSGLPFEALDKLYIQILSTVPARSQSKLCNILCIIATLRLPLRQIEKLLDLKSGDVQLTFRNVNSVLDIGFDNEPIIVHHASFLDFLQDRRRSSSFYVGLDSAHRLNVACAALKVLSWPLDDPRAGVAWYVRFVSYRAHRSPYAL
jgi:hypothetical protein